MVQRRMVIMRRQREHTESRVSLADSVMVFDLTADDEMGRTATDALTRATGRMERAMKDMIDQVELGVRIGLMIGREDGGREWMW